LSGARRLRAGNSESAAYIDRVNDRVRLSIGHAGTRCAAQAKQHSALRWPSLARVFGSGVLQLDAADLNFV
jgi:hypothetical protein